VIAWEGLPVQTAPRVLEVSESGFYEWKRRPPSAPVDPTRHEAEPPSDPACERHVCSHLSAVQTPGSAGSRSCESLGQSLPSWRSIDGLGSIEAS
jgi:hypothetical protein